MGIVNDYEPCTGGNGGKQRYINVVGNRGDEIAR